MITRVEINGFKSFRDFAIDLKPFQVFIGPNGVGKTNFFDAITLLSNLAGDNTLDSALRQSRGELAELFTVHPDGSRATQMQLVAEMLIGRTITDSLGKPFELSSTRLRYELTIERRTEDGRERAYVLSEALFPIKEADDKWIKDQVPTKSRKKYALRDKRPPYIATVGENEQTTIYRNQDTLAGGREGTKVGSIARTILSASDATRYPTINAVRQEMLSWRFMQLHPASLRQPAPLTGAAYLLPDGSNLASVIARLNREGGLDSVLKEMKGMIPAILNLHLKTLDDRNELLFEIETQDHSRFSSRVLSDGTLRLLALVSLRHDAKHQGVVLFEEPENGVQPQRLKQIVDVLYALATDFDRDSDAPLRQVLINTHSPGLLASVPANSLYYVGMKTKEKGRETHVVPVRPELIPDENDRYYTWEQVNAFLDVSEMNKRREELGL